MNTNELILLHTALVQIRWTDVDAYQHVAHSKYFDYLAEARLQWYGQLPFAEKLNYIFPVVEAHMNYKKALFFPGNLVIKTYNVDASEKVWHFHQTIHREDDVDVIYADGWVKGVMYCPKEKRVVIMPNEFRQCLRGG